MQKTFELTEEQIVVLKKFQDKIKKKYGCFGHYDYIFTPYGIGLGIKVVSHLSKQEIDLTDTENW